jgi:methyl-accepting chemotaxis protein
MLLIGGTSPFGEGPVQEAHMLYFVTQAFLLFLVCPIAMITYNAIVVLHHLVLTFLAPTLVWHTSLSQAALINLAVHASIAVTMILPLTLLCRMMMHSAVTSHQALRDAQEANDSMGAMYQRQVAAERAAAQVRETTLRDVRTRLAGALDSIIGSVRSTAATVSEGADDLASSSHSVDQSAADMMREGEGSSRSTTLVAAAVEQLSASVKEVCSQTDAAAQSSTDAATQARAAETTIANLDQSAREIGTIVALISSIASRTNLLALNATIESARAGDAGKGFAVVAAEVKQLANQTAQATESISRQIAAMTERSQAAVAAIGTILQAVRAVDERVGVIAATTQNQQQATSQIAESVGSLSASSVANADRLRLVKRDISSVEARGVSLREAAIRLNETVVTARQDADALLASLAA